MTRRTFIVGATLGLALIVASPAFAGGEEPVPGEVWVKLKGNDYAKPFLNGDEYSDHEFLENGKHLTIRVEDINTPMTFELRPSLDGYEPVEITTETKAFRRKRVRGAKALRMVMTTTAVFEKAEKKEPAEEKREEQKN